MEKLYFFTGENIFALEQEILRWKNAFFAKHGQENFLEISGKNSSMSILRDAVSVMPFIAEKRLVLIRGVPSVDKEEIQFFVDAIHPQTVVVMADATADKRLGSVKLLKSLAEVYESKNLTPYALEAWSKTVLAFLGSTMSTNAWQRLIEIVGTDQWLLDSELRKLSAYAGNTITERHVEEVAVPSGEQVIWRFADLVSSRKTAESFAFLHGRIERGEDPYGLWSILLNMINNTVLVWAAVDGGLRDAQRISSAYGMNVYAVRGLMPLAQSIKKEQLCTLLTFASEADVALKTGGYRYSASHTEEVIALIERAIVHCHALQ